MPTDQDVKPSVEEVVRDQLETVGFRLADMADIPDADCVEVLMTVEQLCERVSDRMEALEARALTAEARLAEAVEALRPFAEKIVDIGEDEDDQDAFRDMWPAHRRAPRINVGHFRRARAIVERQGG